MAFEKKVSIAIVGKTDQFVKSLTKGQKALNTFGSVAGTIGKATVAGLGLASVAAVTVGKEMVDLASSAKEAGSAFDVVFGESGAELNAFVEEFANKAGLANFELQDLLKTSGQVLQGIAFTAEESANLSQALTVVAGDVAAFNNVQGGAQPVLEAFTKALLGERESLKTYGIAINEAEVQTKAFEMTGKSSAAQLTKQEKALATYELIVERSAVTQGYLNAEQDSFAAKSNEARAKLTELKATLGQELLPIAEQLLPVLVDLVGEIGPHLSDAIKSVAPFIASIGGLISALAPPMIQIITLLLAALAPAFKKFTEIVDRFVAPFLTNLPKNFENMINRIIGALNSFIDKINSFAQKAQNMLGKIGIKLDLPKLGRFEEVSFGFADSQVKSVVSPDDIDAQRTATSLLASAAQTQRTAIGQSQGNVIVNNYAPITTDQQAADLFSRGAREFKRQNGGSGRIDIL